MPKESAQHPSCRGGGWERGAAVNQTMGTKLPSTVATGPQDDSSPFLVTLCHSVFLDLDRLPSGQLSLEFSLPSDPVSQRFLFPFVCFNVVCLQYCAVSPRVGSEKAVPPLHASMEHSQFFPDSSQSPPPTKCYPDSPFDINPHEQVTATFTLNRSKLKIQEAQTIMFEFSPNA